MRAETFFSNDDNEMISGAVREVEKKTSGEIAVMVVDRSDIYPEGRILAGVVAGSFFALIVVDLFLASSLWWFVILALGLGFLCGWLVDYLPAVKRIFTPVARLETRVKERAVAAFYENGLYKTRDETGVLFFISLFERKVWVLADEGIYKKIKPEILQAYARSVALGIKSGTAAGALCREIRNVGEILAEHFPIKTDDTNELADEVIVGK